MTIEQMLVLLIVSKKLQNGNYLIALTTEDHQKILLELANRGLILNSMADEKREDAKLINREWILSQHGADTIKALQAVGGLTDYYLRSAVV